MFTLKEPEKKLLIKYHWNIAITLALLRMESFRNNSEIFNMLFNISSEAEYNKYFKKVYKTIRQLDEKYNFEVPDCEKEKNKEYYDAQFMRQRFIEKWGRIPCFDPEQEIELIEKNTRVNEKEKFFEISDYSLDKIPPFEVPVTTSGIEYDFLPNRMEKIVSYVPMPGKMDEAVKVFKKAYHRIKEKHENVSNLKNTLFNNYNGYNLGEILLIFKIYDFYKKRNTKSRKLEADVREYLLNLDRSNILRYVDSLKVEPAPKKELFIDNINYKNARTDFEFDVRKINVDKIEERVAFAIKLIATLEKEYNENNINFEDKRYLSLYCLS